MLGKMLGFGHNEHYRKGVRLFDQGLFEDAIAELEKARAIAPSDPATVRLSSFYTAEAHSSLGQTALRRGAWGRAEHHFREALAINPQFADLHFLLAQALRRRLQFADALEALDAALAINPQFAKALYHRGLTLYAMGRYDEGIEHVQRSVAISPAYDTDALAEAIAAHGRGEHAGAQHALEVVAATEIDDIQFHYRLADDLYRRGKLVEAIAEYRKALDLNANYADVHNHLGMALNALGEHEEAIGEFRRALTINPKFVDAWFNLGTSMRELGRLTDASHAFERVLELDPDRTLAREALAETAPASGT